MDVNFGPLQFIGFVIAGYAIVANDAIQTLGTFLSSNAKRPWWVLWIFACTILAAVLVYGYFSQGGDVSYGRLSKIPVVDITWPYLIPPIALLVLTRLGMPVSTTFLILTFFAPKRLEDMLIKSIAGYFVAFAAAFLLVYFITKKMEGRFLKSDGTEPPLKWVIFQWASTGFLWSQWLIQDLANIYVYLPRNMTFTTLLLTMAVLFALHAWTFYTHGGIIQKIVTSKTNTGDIRSATFIDLTFGAVLLLFKEISNMPMSTTWVFLGILAGREMAMAIHFKMRTTGNAGKLLSWDLGKASIGLVVSIILALGLPFFMPNKATHPKLTQEGSVGEHASHYREASPINKEAPRLSPEGNL